jgi:hypothetical protein
MRIAIGVYVGASTRAAMQILISYAMLAPVPPGIFIALRNRSGRCKTIFNSLARALIGI